MDIKALQIQHSIGVLGTKLEALVEEYERALLCKDLPQAMFDYGAIIQFQALLAELEKDLSALKS